MTSRLRFEMGPTLVARVLVSRRPFLIGMTLLLTSGCRSPAPAAPSAASPTRIYLVRHAEKALAGEDPPLAPAGVRRARSLPTVLPLAALSVVLSTDTRRTRQTAEPVLQATGLGLELMAPTDFAKVRDVAREHAGTAILVVGHSNTIPQLIAALGVQDPVTISDDQYGDVFEVVLDGESARLERLRFEG